MGVRHLLATEVRGVPLYAICLCGMAGILVDVDHFIAYYTGFAGRFLHAPFFILALIMLCCVRRSPLVVALCCAVIAHVIQDYTINWF